MLLLTNIDIELETHHFISETVSLGDCLKRLVRLKHFGNTTMDMSFYHKII